MKLNKSIVNTLPEPYLMGLDCLCVSGGFFIMNNTQEIWEPIKGYEGCYEVSNLGRVRSLTRHVRFLNPTTKNEHFRVVKGQVLKMLIGNKGYYCIGLSKNNNHKSRTVHQLVAIAFLGHEPCRYKVVIDHIDNNKLNNNADNLQLVTQRYNCGKEIRGKSKYLGVTHVKSRDSWAARIMIDNKTKELGLFKHELDASNAYQNKLKEINGLQHGLNLIEE